jgi:pimeloyl-ACP methyl ester carboxylesterase
MGAKEFYSDKSLLRETGNVEPYIDPAVQSARRMQGFLHYLCGIEWSVVDGMATMHRQIEANTLFIWGKHDNTFPLELATSLPAQFNGNARLVPIHGSLLPHEESPAEVLALLSDFLV